MARGAAEQSSGQLLEEDVLARPYVEVMPSPILSPVLATGTCPTRCGQATGMLCTAAVMPVPTPAEQGIPSLQRHICSPGARHISGEFKETQDASNFYVRPISHSLLKLCFTLACS